MEGVIAAFAPLRVLRQHLMRGDISMASASAASIVSAEIDIKPVSGDGWAMEQLTPHARFGYQATPLEKLQTPYQQA